MSAVSFNLRVNDQTLVIKPKEFPKTFLASKALIDAGVNSPELPNLKHRVDRLGNLKERLGNAKNHETRDKVLGVLATIACTILIAAAVGIWISALPPFAIALGFMAALLGYTGISGYYALELGGNESAASFLTLFAGPILPLIEAFTKIPRLERAFSRDLKALETDFSKISTLYGEKRTTLAPYIEQEVQETERTIGILRGLPRKTALGEQEMNLRLEAFQAVKALDQILFPTPTIVN